MLVRTLLTHEQLNEFIALCRGANIDPSLAIKGDTGTTFALAIILSGLKPFSTATVEPRLRARLGLVQVRPSKH
jgi:hypothetical protein